MMGANAALMLLLAGRLELKLYGLLMTSISGQLLLSRALMLGVDRGVIRLRTLPELRHQTRELFNAGLAVIWRMSALSVVAALAVAAAWSFSTASHWPHLVIASVVAGAIGTALVDYGYSVYLSHVQYRAAALSQSATALGRLAIAGLTVLIWPQHPLLVFLAYPGASFASGLAQVAMILPPKSGGEPRPDRALKRRLLQFSVWQGATNFIGLFSLYQGIFLLTWLGDEAAAGVFGLGLALSMGFFAVYIAYAEYLLPRIARVKSLNALPSFLARAFGGALGLALGGIPIAAAIGAIVTRMLNPELHDVTPIFYCLSASMLLLVCQSPLEAACHYLLRPQLGMFSWTLRVIYVGGLALMLVPSRGAWGAAVAQLVGTTLALLSLAVLVMSAMRSARMKEDPRELQ
jgi:O-antigen/teichoic acid export membrane protein